MMILGYLFYQKSQENHSETMFSMQDIMDGLPKVKEFDRAGVKVNYHQNQSLPVLLTTQHTHLYPSDNQRIFQRSLKYQI